MSKITCDGIDLYIESAGYVRSPSSNGISGEARANVRLTLDDGTNRVCVLLDTEARKRLVDELRYGDAVQVPPELNEVREWILKERKGK